MAKFWHMNSPTKRKVRRNQDGIAFVDGKNRLLDNEVVVEEKLRERFARGDCLDPHPTGSRFFCWNLRNHTGYHTAGLEDWEGED